MRPECNLYTLTQFKKRSVRDSNPWSPTWQAGVHSNWTDRPKSLVCSESSNLLKSIKLSWSQWDSNPHPLPCKDSAQPVELWPLIVLRTGFEPVPYHRKWYVLTSSLTQQIVGICSSHILGFPHTLERLERIELSSLDWKSKVMTIIR